MQITYIQGKVELHNGVQMPYLGLGVYKSKDGKEVESAIAIALQKGYRLIDTASYYNNEEGVGKAIKNASIPREQIFVTTKVWNDDHGYEKTIEAFEISLRKLQLSYVDLYMIHWPVPEKYTDTWRALEHLYETGKAKAIGICNCMPHHIETILEQGTIKPMVLQNEFHPRLVQNTILDFCKLHDIQFQAWSPLMRGRILENGTLQKLAKKHKRSTAQIILRWNLQKGICTIPKSVHQHRIIENADLFDFELTSEEIQMIDSLDLNERTGAHPDHFMEHFKQKETNSK